MKVMRSTTFYRPARVYPPVLPTNPILITPPPVLEQPQGGMQGALQVIIPVLGSLTGVVMMLVYRANVLIMMAMGGMAVLMAAGGIATNVIQRSNVKKQRKRQRSGYLEYLLQMRKSLTFLAQGQLRVDTRLYPP